MTAGAFGAYGLVTGLVMLWLLLANAKTAPQLQQSSQDKKRLMEAQSTLSDSIDAASSSTEVEDQVLRNHSHA